MSQPRNQGLQDPLLRLKDTGTDKTGDKKNISSGSSRGKASLLTRAKAGDVRLSRGKDPVSTILPSQKHHSVPDIQPVTVQVRQMPDGSIAGRAKPSQKKSGKPGYPTGHKRGKQVFRPPPSDIAVTPSSSSVQVSRGGFFAACPDDPFAKMLASAR